MWWGILREAENERGRRVGGGIFIYILKVMLEGNIFLEFNIDISFD